MNPDCRDGKHASCTGVGWDEAKDQPGDCPCWCHIAEQFVRGIESVTPKLKDAPPAWAGNIATQKRPRRA